LRKLKESLSSREWNLKESATVVGVAWEETITRRSISVIGTYSEDAEAKLTSSVFDAMKSTVGNTSRAKLVVTFSTSIVGVLDVGATLSGIAWHESSAEGISELIGSSSMGIETSSASSAVDATNTTF